MPLETIGARLERAAKQKKGWTLKQFAAEVGVTYETTRKWVKGHTAPNRARADKIAQLLGETVPWVMHGAGTAAAPPPKPNLNYEDNSDLITQVVNDLDALHPNDKAEWIAELHRQAVKAREIGKRFVDAARPAKGAA